ncbi:MAG TPA: toll/interleukin-1 receptor domain-containing protein, partial [Acidimicrobiales bacterium]
EAAGLLTWSPPDSLAAALAPPPAPPAVTLPDGEPPAADLPPPYEGGGRYLFVSYRHTDLDAIVPVLRSLQDEGWNLWYDRGIPGGSEWNAVLEERLASSHALLLFLSQAAVASKYVRREILFADSIDKPIVGVQLGEVRLEHGLGLMLGHCQLLRRSEPGFLRQLGRALTYVDAA